MSFDLKLTNGSFTVDNGDLAQVRNFDKLSQDVVKIMVTPLGSNATHQWYGSTLSSRVVGSSLPVNLFDQEVTSSVSYALQNLKSLQEQQSRIGQFLTPSEQIAAITDISVIRYENDKRTISVVVGIRTRTGETLEEEISIRL